MDSVALGWFVLGWLGCFWGGAIAGLPCMRGRSTSIISDTPCSKLLRSRNRVVWSVVVVTPMVVSCWIIDVISGFWSAASPTHAL